MRMTRRVRLALAAAFSLLTLVLCLAYGQQVRADADRERAEALERYGGEVTKVVVAGQALEVGDVVSRQNVAERDWVSDLVPKGSYVSLDEVVGRQVTVPASEGSPVTQLNFREAATSADVPDGYVAASVPFGEKLGLPSDIGVGTRVVAFRVGESGARILSDDVQVISSLGEGGALGARASVTLAARPQSVAELLVAGGEGSLRLIVPAEGVSVSERQQAPAEVTAEVPADSDGNGGADDE